MGKRRRDENEIERGITYDSILTDLKDLKYNHYITELERKLNNGENINQILISIITKNKDTKSTIGYHKNTIQHFDYPNKKHLTTSDFLPNKTPIRIILTSGASCPDSVIEGVIHKINSFYTDIKSIDEVIKHYIGINYPINPWRN